MNSTMRPVKKQKCSNNVDALLNKRTLNKQLRKNVQIKIWIHQSFQMKHFFFSTLDKYEQAIE